MQAPFFSGSALRTARLGALRAMNTSAREQGQPSTAQTRQQLSAEVLRLARNQGVPESISEKLTLFVACTLAISVMCVLAIAVCVACGRTERQRDDRVQLRRQWEHSTLELHAGGVDVADPGCPDGRAAVRVDARPRHQSVCNNGLIP